MEASQSRRDRMQTVLLSNKPYPSPAEDQENLVIENLAELGGAGAAGMCTGCWADCAAPAA
jgi:hypothetical protein